MIDEILDSARMSWGTWFGESNPEMLHSVAVRGGPAHSERGMLVLFDDQARSPRAILKIAFSDRESGYLKREFENLSSLHPATSGSLQEGVPRPLGWHELGNAHVLSMEAVPGRRLLHPYLPDRPSLVAKRVVRSFLERTFEWSRTLSEVGEGFEQERGSSLADLARQFADVFVDDGPAMETVLDFAEYLDSADGLVWRRTWQHCATDITNALSHRGDLRFVDWEHASANSHPWFDVSYAPLAFGRLAIRQSSGRIPFQVLCESLASSGPVGTMIREGMERSWTYPLPMPMAVVLTAMEVALRRNRQSQSLTAELAVGLLANPSIRGDLRWLAPTW